MPRSPEQGLRGFFFPRPSPGSTAAIVFPYQSLPMKRWLLPATAAILLLAGAAAWIFLPQNGHTGGGGAPAAGSDPGRQFALTVSSVTGLAISPLMATGAVGAYQYFQTESAARGGLPWFAQPWFWIPALLLTGAVFAKDTLGVVVPPGLKKPFDAVEVMEDKVSALFAAGAIAPLIGMLMTAGATQSSALAPAGTALAHAGFLPLEFAALPAWAWSILLAPLAIAVFAVVWLVSHAITILVLISPFPAVDAALKAARASVLGLVTLTAAIHPWTALLLSLVIILISALVVGWAFRLTVFGTVFTFDVLGRRWRRAPDPAASGALAFAGRRLAGVPRRTLGRLLRQPDGQFVFRFRPWLVLPWKEASLPTGPALVGRGLFHPDLRVTVEGKTKPAHVLSFPPRYRTHEAALAAFAGATVVDTGVLKGLKAMWSWTLDSFGRGETAEAAPAEPATPGPA